MQNPSACPTLMAQRIYLRPIQATDAKDLFSLWSNESTSEMGGIERPKDIDSIVGSIAYFNVLNDSGFFLKWCMCDKKTDSFLGEIELYPLKPQIRPWSEWSIGYSLNESARGKGFMSEALEAVLKYGFNDLSVLRIKADVPEKNVKSLKLLRRNGFSYEGVQVNKLFVNGVFKNMSQLAITRARYFEGKRKL